MSGELMKIDQKEIAILGNRFRLMNMGRLLQALFDLIVQSPMNKT